MTTLALDRPEIVEPAAHTTCAHCANPIAGAPVSTGSRFCCAGCGAAYATIQGLGLGAYYARFAAAATAPLARPEAVQTRDLTAEVETDAQGRHRLELAVDGLRCGACVWLIESVLARQPGLRRGRLNMTTRRLRLEWEGDATLAGNFVAAVEALGYRLMPFDAASLNTARGAEERRLMRALGVAGFAAGNVMLLSLGIWWGLAETMGPATRGLMHWVSALIALPAIAYAGMPFFTSAWAALRQGRTNMDVPISIGVALVSVMSLAETARGGAHAYFDSAAALLFFLLAGRLLDARARGIARSTAESLLALRGSEVTLLGPDGQTRRQSARGVAVGATVLVAMGERIGADGVVTAGTGSVDTSLVTGESLPVAVRPGALVHAGTLNLGGALTMRVTASGQGTLLAECARLIAAAEARRGRMVALADRVARAYAPVVHVLAALSFLGWYFAAGVAAHEALLVAASVLIITCPCALALAVPAVQVIAASGLFRSGILLKSATALERLAQVDTVVLDKTGTLTLPQLVLAEGQDHAALEVAAGLAAASRHPLARALLRGVEQERVVAREGVVEHPGGGVSVADATGEIRLGSRAFCRLAPATESAEGPELWLARPGQAAVQFRFTERLRPGAEAAVRDLRAMGLAPRILSGDRQAATALVAAQLGIAEWRAGLTPPQKLAEIEALRAAGKRVLMVGDGLNDAPSLAGALVSASPSSAADISQTTADAVFPDQSLIPLPRLVRVARTSARLMRQNIALAIGYNAVMVPLAMAGRLTPWIAALAMSTSSLLVIGNAFRARGGGER